MAPNSKNKKFSEEKIKKAWQDIKKANKITFLTHFKPDGDGISACAALDSICSKLGKNTETVYPTKPEFKVKRHSKNILINKHKQTPELIIICDTANYERVYFPKEFESIPSINIDHHISNTINSTYNFIDPNASSTCEVLYELIEKWNKDLIDKYISEALLFGILYDSQVFHTQSVTSQTLRISADLMDLGANLFEIKTELLSNKNYKIILLWGDVLKKVKLCSKGTAIWTKVTKKNLEKYKLTLRSLIGFNNFLSQLCDIDITLFFYETDSGKTKVSLRSKKADVNLLARQFGGGGHKNAAGILTDEPMDKLIKEITSLL